MWEFLQIFFSQAVIQRTIVDFPAFLETGLAEKISVCVHKNEKMKKNFKYIVKNFIFQKCWRETGKRSAHRWQRHCPLRWWEVKRVYYIEYQSVCSIVWIGSPHPLPRKRVWLPPRTQRGEEQHFQTGEGPQFIRLDRHSGIQYSNPFTV